MIKETIELEDGLEYIITDEINNYLYLNNVNNLEDFCIRKRVIIDNENCIVGLEDDDEIDKALNLLEKKYQ